MKSFLILLVAMIAINSKAQTHSINIQNGITLASLTGNYHTDKPLFKLGFISGLSYEYQSDNNWLYSIGVEYQQKGVKYDASFWLGMDSTDWTVYRKNNYINMPISLGYSYGNKLSGNFYFGLVPSFLIGSDVTQVYVNHDEYIFKDNHIEKFDINGLVQIGLSYKINDKFKISNQIRFQHGLINLYHGTETNVRNLTYSYLIGLHFYLKTKETKK